MSKHESDTNKARANLTWKTGKRTINGRQITVATMTTEGGKRVLRVTVNRESVKIYERTTPSGYVGFQVANFSEGKRKLESLKTEAAAVERAESIARKLDAQQAEAATITSREALTFTRANELLAPLGESLEIAVARYVEAAQTVGGSSRLIEAARFFAKRNPDGLPAKAVATVVTELIALKVSRGASPRYVKDLRHRLGQFAESFQVNIGGISTAEIQGWLDGRNLKPQTYRNHKTVLTLLFNHAVARGYCFENPLGRVESRKVKNGEGVVIYTPAQISRLLQAAGPDFRPCLALGAFCGVRTAELHRLRWQDVDFAERHVVVGVDQAKTASRRIVPMPDNLLAWLEPYRRKTGLVWPSSPEIFNDAQQDTAKAAQAAENELAAKENRKPLDLHWRKNGLRHSFCSYRLAVVKDSGQVALEAGNSAQVVFRHYRQAVTEKDGTAYFAVSPEQPANVVSIHSTSAA